MIATELARLATTLAAEVGVREVGGQNRGPRVAQYQAATGNGPGDSWCMSFLVWGLLQVLGRSPIPRSGSCQDVYAWASRAGFLTQTPGFGRLGLVVRRADNHAHHTFFVTANPSEDGSFPTIEGNTNDRGDSNGDGVYRRRRGGDDDPIEYWFVDLASIPSGCVPQ